MTHPSEQSLIQRIAELEQENEKLREDIEHSKNHELFEIMAQGVVRQNRDGVIISANPAAARILGLTMDQLLGRTSIDPRWRTIHENGDPYPGDSHPAMIALRTGKSVRDTMGVFNPAYGGFSWLLVHAEPIFRDDEDEPSEVFTTFEDITERRQAAESYNRLCEMASELICVADINTATFLQVNPAFTDVLGWEKEELLSQPFLSFVHPDDIPSTLHVIDEKLQKGENVIVFENRYRCKNGSYRILRWNSHPAPQEGLTYAIAHDVTEEKKTQKALQYSESLARTVIENSPIGISVRAADGRLLLYNDAWRNIWEISEERLTQDMAPRERFAMNERDDYLSDNQKHVARVFTEGGQFTIPELHTTGKRSISGRRRWISQHFNGIKNDAGEVERVVVLTTDITERKQAELQIEHNTHLLETLHEIDQAIIGLQSPSDIAAAVLRHIKLLAPFDAGIVMMLDRERMQLEVLYELSESHPIAPAGGVYNLSLASMAMIDRTPDHFIGACNSALADVLGRKGNPQEHGMQSSLLQALRFKNELVGFVGLMSTAENAFSDNYFDLTEEIAASLAIALTQHKLFEQVRRDAETKTLLLQEINHRVKNNLASIISFLSAKQMTAPDELRLAYSSIAGDLRNRVQALLTAHDLLSRSEWQPIELAEIVERVAGGVSTPRRRLQANVEGETILVSSSQAHNLALIFNELAANIVKHLPDDRDEATVTVTISSDDQNIHIRFRDNGPGYPADVLSAGAYNVGLHVVQAMVEKSLRGSIELSNDGGAVVDMKLSKKMTTGH